MDGKDLGRVTYTAKSRTPSWSMMVFCKLHGCRCAISSKWNPSEDGALKWLQHGRVELNHFTDRASHSASFRAYVCATGDAA